MDDHSDKLHQLNLPAAKIQLFKEGKEIFFHDIIRNKKLILTPEEWVRQHIVHYLIEHLHYPKGLFQLEAPVKINQLDQRSDVIVYDKNGEVFMLVECKSYNVKISQFVFDQAIRYNSKIKAKYVMISNGMDHHCFFVNKEKTSIEVLDAFPDYVEN